MTSNTSANDNDQMWLIDNNFYGVKVKMPIDYSARTFWVDDVPYDADTTGYVTITNGKILENAGTNIHGVPVDSIVFDCVFTDFYDGYTIRYSGIRYEGFLRVTQPFKKSPVPPRHGAFFSYERRETRVELQRVPRFWTLPRYYPPLYNNV